MALAVTVASIIADARQIADEANSQFVADAVARQWVNKEFARLRDRLDAAAPEMNMTSTNVVTTANTLEYTVPANFKSLLAVWLMRGANRYPVEPFQLHERSTGDSTYWAPYGLSVTRYAIRGQGTDGTGVRLVFDRNPGNETYEMEYIPAPQQFATDGSEDEELIDGVSGWEDLLINRIARRMMIKGQKSIAEIQLLISEDENRIAFMATQRDAGRPNTVQDVRGYSRYAWR